MQQRKSKTILLYLFFLSILGSINNINFSDLKYVKIQKIKISGLNQNKNLSILEEIKKLNLNNIFFLNSPRIENILISNSLIENFEIFRKYPSTLEIKINKTTLLAKIKKKDKIFIIGSNGKLSSNDVLNKKIPFIYGSPEIKEFLKFKKIIDDSKFSYEKINKLYFFPSKRWDIELKNNVILKLPKDNLKNSLDNAYIFLNEKNFKDSKVIDVRLKNQIILND